MPNLVVDDSTGNHYLASVATGNELAKMPGYVGGGTGLVLFLEFSSL